MPASIFPLSPLHFVHAIALRSFCAYPVTVVAREHAHADPFLAISSVVFINACIQRTSGLRNRRHSCAKMKSVFDPKSGWVGHNLLQIWPKIGIFLKIFIVPSKNPRFFEEFSKKYAIPPMTGPNSPHPFFPLKKPPKFLPFLPFLPFLTNLGYLHFDRFGIKSFQI